MCHQMCKCYLQAQILLCCCDPSKRRFQNKLKDEVCLEEEHLTFKKYEAFCCKQEELDFFSLAWVLWELLIMIISFVSFELTVTPAVF